MEAKQIRLTRMTYETHEYLVTSFIVRQIADGSFVTESLEFEVDGFPASEPHIKKFFANIAKDEAMRLRAADNYLHRKDANYQGEIGKWLRKLASQ